MGGQSKKDRTWDESAERYRRDVAVFRYGVIDELDKLRPGDGSLAQRIQEIAQQEHDIPGSTRTRVAESTVRGWLRDYRRGGLDALYPKTRADRGRPRHLSVEVAEALLEQKRGQPSITVKDAIARVRGELQLGEAASMPASTVHRLFQREGLMSPAPAAPQDRRRYSYEYAGELWMSDVTHTPAARDERGRWRKTYLIVFLDDATRVVPYAAFHFSESAGALLQVLKQAVMRRGVPLRLYVDNGSGYVSRQLALVCARLDIALIHARPYQPAGKGKIERFNRTCKSRFVAHLSDDERGSLEAMNASLRVWLEKEYHYTPHRGLNGATPLDQWARCARNVRLADARIDLDDLFLFEERRKVLNDRTLRLHNSIYEVEPHLMGQTVTVGYDPQAPAGQPLKITDSEGRVSRASLVDVHANARIKRTPPDSLLSFADYNREEH